MKTYHGGCHCGCTKKAMLGCYVTAEDFKLLQGGNHFFMRPRSNPAAAQEARRKAQRGEG